MTKCKCPKERRYCVDHPVRADSCYVCVDMICIDCGKQSKATFSVTRIKDGKKVNISRFEELLDE